MQAAVESSALAGRDAACLGAEAESAVEEFGQSLEWSMSKPTVHECPDGARFRISQVQAIRKQILFSGESFVFQVEPESEGTGFEMSVHYAPIFLNIASPEERLRTDDIALDLVRGALDRGRRESVEIRVTSDGAVKVGGELVDRVYPLARPA